MKQLYLEDLSVGQRFLSRSLTLGAEEMVRFARDNDPQFFHADEEAAKDSVFGGLIGSGWQTAALTVKLILDSAEAPFAGGVVGANTEVQWRQPVRPGDALRVEAVVTKIVKSRSRPDRGFVSMETKTLNQRDEIVQTLNLTMVAFSDPARRAG